MHLMSSSLGQSVHTLIRLLSNENEIFDTVREKIRCFTSRLQKSLKWQSSIGKVHLFLEEKFPGPAKTIFSNKTHYLEPMI